MTGTFGKHMNYGVSKIEFRKLFTQNVIILYLALIDI